MLGLISGKTFTDNDFHKRNFRRKIFHDYPNGKFPLTGLLSIMESTETDSPEFGWFEKRFVEPETSVLAGGNRFSAAGSDTPISSPATLTSGTTYRVNVGDSSDFQERQIIQVADLYVSAGVFVTVQGVITTVIDGTKIEFRATEEYGPFVNTATAAPLGPEGTRIMVVGNASTEGAISTTGILRPPLSLTNYTQIFRNSFSFTRTALKQPTEFDGTGIYKEAAKDNILRHMTEIEKAFLWGTKSIQYVTVDGDSLPIRTTGGVLWYLKEWEKADSVYRGGSGASAITSNADDQKRIIKPTGGSMTGAEWNTYIERAFRVTSDESFEKIIMCGSGFLSALNEYLEGKSTLFRKFTPDSSYGMNVVSYETPHGTVHLKTHPLFTRNVALRHSALLLDINYLDYRPLNDSDTQLYKNRQGNDYDGRKDEWLTEAGLEVMFPEAHMYFDNVQEITNA